MLLDVSLENRICYPNIRKEHVEDKRNEKNEESAPATDSRHGMPLELASFIQFDWPKTVQVAHCGYHALLVLPLAIQYLHLVGRVQKIQAVCFRGDPDAPFKCNEYWNAFF